ncbi:MAG TPA: hypothetical protein PKA64_21450 [Myxococcota bacterium]|nr:hypothetical protein [Myxococcota bacterium]
MFRILSLVLASLVAVPTVEAMAQEATQSTSAAEHMVQSIEAEGHAMQDCAAAVKADVAAKKVKLTSEAAGRWEAGAAKWSEVKSLAAAGNEKAAFDELRELRTLFGETLLVAFEGKASKTTRDAFTSYWKVAQTRIDHIVEYGKSHELSDEVKSHYTAGVDHWDKAKAALSAKQNKEAFTQMLRGLDELDQVMWSVHTGE